MLNLKKKISLQGRLGGAATSSSDHDSNNTGDFFVPRSVSENMKQICNRGKHLHPIQQIKIHLILLSK